MMGEIENQDRIDADSLVQDVVRDHPQTVLVFVRRRLHCVGCTMAPFHTIADSAREHAVALDPLLGALNKALPAPRVGDGNLSLREGGP